MSVMQSVIPTVLEQSSRGERAFDIYSLLLRERIIFLGQEVDDQVANLLVSEILYLESQDPERDIHLYINSPGGLSYAGMAIYDVMQHVRCEVSTICVGMGMSAAAMILCGGAPGKRLALPSAKIMIQQGTAGMRDGCATTYRSAAGTFGEPSGFARPNTAASTGVSPARSLIARTTDHAQPRCSHTSAIAEVSMSTATTPRSPRRASRSASTMNSSEVSSAPFGTGASTRGAGWNFVPVGPSIRPSGR